MKRISYPTDNNYSFTQPNPPELPHEASEYLNVMDIFDKQVLDLAVILKTNKFNAIGLTVCSSLYFKSFFSVLAPEAKQFPIYTPPRGSSRFIKFTEPDEHDINSTRHQLDTNNISLNNESNVLIFDQFTDTGRTMDIAHKIFNATVPEAQMYPVERFKLFAGPQNHFYARTNYFHRQAFTEQRYYDFEDQCYRTTNFTSLEDQVGSFAVAINDYFDKFFEPQFTVTQ